MSVIQTKCTKTSLKLGSEAWQLICHWWAFLWQQDDATFGPGHAPSMWLPAEKWCYFSKKYLSASHTFNPERAADMLFSVLFEPISSSASAASVRGSFSTRNISNFRVSWWIFIWVVLKNSTEFDFVHFLIRIQKSLETKFVLVPQLCNRRCYVGANTETRRHLSRKGSLCIAKVELNERHNKQEIDIIEFLSKLGKTCPHAYVEALANAPHNQIGVKFCAVRNVVTNCAVRNAVTHKQRTR